MKNPICIYHGNCADGFGAAWVVRKAIPDCEFHAGVYQNEPPDVRGRDVILVDFSYKRPVLEAMARVAASLLIIDHHKTAIDELGDLMHVNDLRHHEVNSYQDVCEGVQCSWYSHFDLNRSGAGLAWDFFFPGEPRPELINRIEDRDLWRFAYADTRAIQAAVFSYPYDFDTWDMLFKADLSVLRTEGEAIERKHHKDIAELVAANQRWLKIGGYMVPVANLPYTLTSDAGHLMCGMFYQDGFSPVPFAACYWDTEQGRVFSLRSVGEMDVSEIAKQYGGGGHKNASGFRLSYEAAKAFEVS